MVNNQIKALRVSLEMTQAELADQAGVRRETIVFLEQGKYNPSLQLAAKVSRILGKPIESVFELGEKN
jgi:putative transcriptional regulator